MAGLDQEKSNVTSPTRPATPFLFLWHHHCGWKESGPTWILAHLRPTGSDATLLAEKKKRLDRKEVFDLTIHWYGKPLPSAQLSDFGLAPLCHLSYCWHNRFLEDCPIFNCFKDYFRIKMNPGSSGASSSKGSTLPMQGARVQSLVRELDPTCSN